MIFSMDNAASVTAGATAAEIDLTMSTLRQFRLVASPAAGIWFRIVAPGGTGAAAAGAGSHYLPPGEVALVSAIGTARTRVSVIREASTDGLACLSEIVHVVS